jgi:hypothetical protein
MGLSLWILGCCFKERKRGQIKKNSMENDLRLKESKGDSSPLRESVLEFQKNSMENDLRLRESECSRFFLLTEGTTRIFQKNIIKTT